jgi:AraC family transcriptional regulator of adaptative response/methylated-DNA-[protein]-cysteine methyltransferase
MTQMPHSDESAGFDTAQGWNAVLARDRAADDTFVYAVRSTGIYCRPSCPSRRPHRKHVLFFATGHDAEQAGFRPCRRCRPEQPSTRDPWLERIERACVYLANVTGHPSLEQLSARLGGSPYHLQRNFKRLVGVSPREYAEACRIQKVKQALRNGQSVTRAVTDAGYGSSSRFYERAESRLGMTPSRYRRRGAGETIRYAIVASAIGRVLAAVTDRGVCAVSIGEDDSELVRALAREYPAATIRLDRQAVGPALRQLLAHAEGRRAVLELPLDIRATAFQRQVWNVLAAIPYGETRSYADVAAALGRPRAARAVARACATNPVALAIPCHRVVPASGGVGGYRWGVARKRAILDREAKRR